MTIFVCVIFYDENIEHGNFIFCTMLILLLEHGIFIMDHDIFKIKSVVNLLIMAWQFQFWNHDYFVCVGFFF